MIVLTKWQKILATMFDLCGGAAKPLQYEDIVVEAFKKYSEIFSCAVIRNIPIRAARKQLLSNG